MRLFGEHSPIGMKCDDQIVSFEHFLPHEPEKVKLLTRLQKKETKFTPNEYLLLHEIDEYLDVPLVRALCETDMEKKLELCCEYEYLHCIREMSLKNNILTDTHIRSVKVVKVLISMGYTWDENSIDIASTYGNLELVKYYREIGSEWDDWTFSLGILSGNLELVKYLHTNGCSYDSWSTLYACENGFLEICKYLHTNGFICDAMCCIRAAEFGHLELLKYLCDHGFSLSEECCEYASDNQHVHIVEYLHEHNCPCLHDE